MSDIVVDAFENPADVKMLINLRATIVRVPADAVKRTKELLAKYGQEHIKVLTNTRAKSKGYDDFLPEAKEYQRKKKLKEAQDAEDKRKDGIRKGPYY